MSHAGLARFVCGVVCVVFVGWFGAATIQLGMPHSVAGSSNQFRVVVTGPVEDEAAMCHRYRTAVKDSVWLWLCGCVAVWLCGCVVVWLHGCVAAWLRGCVAV